MESIKCAICDKEVSGNNGTYIGIHVKRTHNISTDDYVKKYYRNLTADLKLEKCGFCDNEALPFIEVDHHKRIYSLSYNKGYFCNTMICKENISHLIFGVSYNKKQFEHIGSNSQYLSLLYKKSVEDVKYDKSKGFRELEWKCNLEHYVTRYGKQDGIKKYEERNKKISCANTLSWFIEKYGPDGKNKYEIFRKKKHKAFGPNKSVKSRIINYILDKNHVNYTEEFKYENEIGKNGAVDFYLPDNNLIIEYYGDYWHCNPKYYDENYYHKILKRFSYEIWDKDKKRINYLYEKVFNKKIAILILWESLDTLEEQIKIHLTSGQLKIIEP